MRTEIEAAIQTIGLDFFFGEPEELNLKFSESLQDEICALFPYTRRVEMLGSGRANVTYDCTLLFMQPIDLDSTQDNASSIVSQLKDYSDSLANSLDALPSVEMKPYTQVLGQVHDFDTNFAGVLMTFQAERQENIC